MEPEERPRSRQAIHNIRDHLGTLTTNVELLRFEKELSDKGRTAVARIDSALAEIRQELEGLRTVVIQRETLFQRLRQLARG
jgi:hypothetical protein